MPKIGEIHDRLTAAEYKEQADQFKSLYVEEDGAYVYKDPKTLKESMVNAKNDKQKLSERVTEYETKYKDVDPDEYRTLKVKAKDFEDIDKVKQGEINQIKADLEQKFGTQLSAAQKRVVDQQAKYADRILGDNIKAALAQAGVTEGGADLLTGNIRSQVTTKWGDNDEPEFRILDTKGGQRLTDAADPYEIKDLVAEAKKKHPQLFGSSAGSGSGAGGGDKNAAVPTDETPSKWNFDQKRAYINQHGHKALEALVAKEAAAKRANRKSA